MPIRPCLSDGSAHERALLRQLMNQTEPSVARRIDLRIHATAAVEWNVGNGLYGRGCPWIDQGNGPVCIAAALVTRLQGHRWQVLGASNFNVMLGRFLAVISCDDLRVLRFGLVQRILKVSG